MFLIDVSVCVVLVLNLDYIILVLNLLKVSLNTGTGFCIGGFKLLLTDPF